MPYSRPSQLRPAVIPANAGIQSLGSGRDRTHTVQGNAPTSSAGSAIPLRAGGARVDRRPVPVAAPEYQGIGVAAYPSKASMTFGGVSSKSDAIPILPANAPQLTFASPARGHAFCEAWSPWQQLPFFLVPASERPRSRLAARREHVQSSSPPVLTVLS